MPSPETKPPLIVIIGPTAVGKTETSLQLAERLKGEIVSADSRLFYRGMNIGTAKPSQEELARVPHHLVDVANPDQTWSLAMFQRASHRIIADIHARGRLPFIVGGTGQYVKSVIEEWKIPEAAPDLRMRHALENWASVIGPEGLYERLTVLDPAAAARIDSRNMRRTIRALEVILLTGKLFSTQKSRGSSRYRVFQLGLIRPRPELYARIDARIEAMLEAGFVEEVRDLLAAGYAPDLPSLSAIGYRQIIAYLQGEIDLEEAVMLMKRYTRRFVRRQANWFKLDDLHIHWFSAGVDATDEMVSAIRAFLSSERS
jgi:tRNA dimethylallyltransferase